jgi:hypothetical protein
MLKDLPQHISLSLGRLEITADSAVAMLESLALLAQAMQNDLTQVQAVWSARLEMCQWKRETLDKESIWDEARSISLSRL